MSYPTSATALVPIRQDSDGAVVETYTIPASTPYTHRLGSSLSPALPSGWQLIPKGAFPIQPPAAPTGAASAETGGLVSGGRYSWLVTNCTAYGETTYSPTLGVNPLVGTAYTLTLPTNTQGTPDAPVLFRRLYRITNGGGTYYLVTELRDLAQTTYTDKVADADLGPAAPGVNTTGIPAVVTLSGASTTWTEQAPGSTLTGGGYIIDYGYSPTGGTITHAAADAGKTLTATYSAATLISSAYENSLIGAIRDIGAAAGAANGIATTDAGNHLVQIPPHGIMSYASQAPIADSTSLTSFGSYSVFPHLLGLTFTNPYINIGVRVSCFFGGVDSFPGSFASSIFSSVLFGFKIGGVGAIFNLGSILGIQGVGASGTVCYEIPGGSAPVGTTQTFSLYYQTTSAAHHWACRPSAFPDYEFLVFEVYSYN